MRPNEPRNPRALHASTQGIRHFIPTGGTLAALALLFSPPTSAEVVFGIDDWDNTTAPTVTVTATDITATATASAAGGWGLEGGGSAGRGSSKDGTWGANLIGTPASTVTDTQAANFALTNGKTDGEVTITITNNGATDLELGAFHLDAVAFRPNAARTYTLNVLEPDAPGVSAISVGQVFQSEDDAITSLNGNLLTNDADPLTHDQHDDIDIDLTGLADSTLEAGGTAIFQIAFSSGTGSGGGHHLFLDNVGLTTASSVTDQFVITSVPATDVVAGSDFSVTVEAQDSGGSPVLVGSDTEVTLTSSGAGPLAGNVAIIPAGSSSVTFTAVQATLAETITLNALPSGGDPFNPSPASDPINIIAGPASQLVIETAIDGSGEPVGDLSMIPDAVLNLFAISRDAAGNFIALETGAVFTLANTTGDLFPDDLIDNEDGSADFIPFETGTTNIQASVAGLPDALTGLITVEELVNRFTGAGPNGNWQTAANWFSGILPDFDDTTDLFFSDPSNSKGSPYIGTDISVRSITFEMDSTASLNLPLVEPGNVNGANLTFDTDSTTEPAQINVDAAFTGNIIIGFTASSAGTDRNVLLADDLLVTHDGAGLLTINGDILDAPESSQGITKAGTGTLLLSGFNDYSGATNVEAGCLVLGSINSVLDLTDVSVSSGAGFGAIVGPGGLSDAELQDIVNEVNWTAGASLIIDTNGQDVTVATDITGDIGLIKKGAGILTLTGNNTFTGPTVIEAGSIAGSEETPIIVSSVTRSGTEVSLTFTADGNVDVYKSTDLQDFGATPIATDVAPGTAVIVDAAATEPAAFYVLVPTGDPAP